MTASRSLALRASPFVKVWALVGVAVSMVAAGIGHPCWAGIPSPYLAESGVRDLPRLSTGEEHACIVRSDGAVACWGRNNQGQLGDGTTTDRATPGIVPDVSDAVAVAAGGSHTCALLVNGHVRCWGSNSSGQLGDNTQTRRLRAVDVAELSNAVAITAGHDHTCARLANGHAQCWGANADGQLGDGSVNPRLRPTDVQLIATSSVIAIAAGRSHTCALVKSIALVTQPFDVKCWGRNSSGQLGDGTTTSRATPVPVSIDGDRVVAITTGGFHTCALLTTGNVQCWGFNSDGQIGDGSTTTRRTPVPVTLPGNAVKVTAGTAHTCALLVDGRLQCWGANGSGRLGDGTTTRRVSPVPVNGLSNVTAVAAGEAFACATLVTGAKQCWGSDAFGQLGNGFSTNNVVAAEFAARAVSLGRRHTCAFRSGGTAACWGENASGQIGDGTFIDRSSPTPPSGLSNATGISTGDSHTCATGASGVIRCWGENGEGQLGDGTFIDRPTPNSVLAFPIEVAIAGGAAHTCAIRASGAVECWGVNTSGELGDTTTTSRPFGNIPVFGVSNAVAISAGRQFTCALQASGDVACWGRFLGNDNVVRFTVPILSTVVAIAAGDAHACALTAGGQVQCWGRNDDGQLGDGTTLDHATPVRVVGLTDAVAVAAGGGHSCALLANGTVQCWGRNSAGQLGDGTTAQRFFPVPVIVRVVAPSFVLETPLKKVVQIAAGRDHTCATLVGGGVSCWGDNVSGQVGDGTTTDRTTAVSVASFSLNIDPAGSLAHSGRVATVDVIAVCDPGRQLHVEVEVTQQSAEGSGVGQGRCTGRFERYPVTVAAHGPDSFVDGAADVSAVAIIRERGVIVDAEGWQRKVDLQPAP